jgi:acyl carrier protein
MEAAATTSSAGGGELIELIAEILDVEPDELDDESGPDTLESWTSRAHFELVTALEEELGVTFSQADIQGMRSIGDARRILLAKGARIEP